MDKTATRCYCNVMAQERGLDPVGTAGHFQDAVLLEAKLPWTPELYKQAGVLPQEAIDLLALWLERYYAGEGYPHRPLMIAPDPDYSQPGMRRLMVYSRPDGPFAAYDKVEYLVPEDQLGTLLWALFEARDTLAQFEPYRDPQQDSTRELLVCTHGTVDAACAKFGYPLYKHLRDHYASDALRVWRVSHFGGHVFAPTLMDMPTGHYWAYVDEPQAGQIARRCGDVRDLYGYYRGWAGLKPGFLQAAERELWMQQGWGWFDTLKTGQVIEQDPDAENPQWADVQIDFAEADTQRFRVEVGDSLMVTPSSASQDERAFPQYHVLAASEPTG